MKKEEGKMENFVMRKPRVALFLHSSFLILP
jgi:hypothetical protein